MSVCNVCMCVCNIRLNCTCGWNTFWLNDGTKVLYFGLKPSFDTSKKQQGGRERKEQHAYTQTAVKLYIQTAVILNNLVFYLPGDSELDIWRQWGTRSCRIGSELRQQFYFFVSAWVRLKSQEVCNSSLADPPPLGTMAISAPLGRLGLLLGAPRERWGRVLLSYGSQTLSQACQLSTADSYIWQSLHPTNNLINDCFRNFKAARPINITKEFMPARMASVMVTFIVKRVLDLYHCCGEIILSLYLQRH